MRCLSCAAELPVGARFCHSSVARMAPMITMMSSVAHVKLTIFRTLPAIIDPLRVGRRDDGRHRLDALHALADDAADLRVVRGARLWCIRVRRIDGGLWVQDGAGWPATYRRSDWRLSAGSFDEPSARKNRGASYPSRSTVAGSSPAARRAGTQAASTPAATNTAAAPTNVAGSRASTCNNSGPTNRSDQHLPANPTTTPPTINTPTPRGTRRTIPVGCAP